MNIPGYETVAQASERTGYEQGHLRLLIRKGAIEANKIGTVWFIREETLSEYISEKVASGDKRSGPKHPQVAQNSVIAQQRPAG